MHRANDAFVHYKSVDQHCPISTAIIQVMEWCEMPKADMDCLVSKESAAQIHVVFMGQGLQPEALEQRRLKGDYAKIVAFRPTGTPSVVAL